MRRNNNKLFKTWLKEFVMQHGDHGCIKLDAAQSMQLDHMVESVLRNRSTESANSSPDIGQKA